MAKFWSAPCCESCWIEDNSHFEGPGNLVLDRNPARVVPQEPECCGFCDEWTISGIYVRASTDDAPYGNAPVDE